MRVRYNVLARLDVVEILEFYEREAGPEIAVAFFADLEQCLDNIRRRPNSYPLIRRKIRPCLLTRFPHEINFEIVNARELKILSVKHQSRHPDYGMDRG